MSDHAPGNDRGFHGHAHEHAGAPAHVHPHHHRTEPGPAIHQHAHTTSFEALTYIVSPLHSLDARAKIIATLVVVIGVASTPPLMLAEFALTCALLAAIGVLGHLPLTRLLARSLVVLPAAATIALLAPMQQSGGSWNAAGLAAAWSGDGWMIAWGILSKAWLSACFMLLLSATTRTADLLGGLRSLHVPAVFVMLLAFIARYVSVLGDQLHSLRMALASRAPRVSGRMLLRALGSITGNLFVRSYERGERVYAAMLSRGYTGVPPVATAVRPGIAEFVLVAMAALSVAALALY
ncbi:MAG: cobalt ECF transporter T component CbiQ [Actinobacteria bacterium]|nr:cobalt ECF transporter T component CbiQ [Actinomycetota bacterium]